MRDAHMVAPGGLKALGRREPAVALAQLQPGEEGAQRQVRGLVDNIVQPVYAPHGQDVKEEARGEEPRGAGRFMVVVERLQPLKKLRQFYPHPLKSSIFKRPGRRKCAPSFLNV
ncbi:MAG: hypothetical protein COT18_02690 [Elusimicrobia bacterium CG08_land_8_20_14_0_20_59_10]|nr:MAG: hypothetical protein COT18_02690 [Elusimicrobia bacterium CG08_land_8_20_14_0_20_59_10]